MKTTDSGHHDEPLRKLLREWRTDAALPPRFQEGVWHLIDQGPQAAHTSLRAIIVHWTGSLLPRPALAVSYVVVLLAIGVTAGWAQARHDTARVKDEIGQRYVWVLDPYLAPRQ